MMCSYELIVSVALLAINWRSVHSVKCNLRASSSCICDMDDHSGSLDLTAISKNDGTAFFTNINQYSFNPCFPYQDNKCQTQVAVCQSGKEVCGRQNSVEFAITSTSPIKGTLSYGGGDDLNKKPRVAVITFQCDPKTAHDLKFTKESPAGTYLFTLTSASVCLIPTPTTHPTKAPPPPPPTTQPAPPIPTTSSGHSHSPRDNAISLGTILDVCALLLIVSYVAAGSSFMYFRRGVRGREVLPNYEFWIGFPGLIKEGCLFVFQKAKSLRGVRGGYEQL